MFFFRRGVFDSFAKHTRPISCAPPVIRLSPALIVASKAMLGGVLSFRYTLAGHDWTFLELGFTVADREHSPDERRDLG